MVKSRIIKEFAKNQIDLENIMKQLKLLLYDLGVEEYSNWIKYELEGYPTGVEVPEYRKHSGILKGTFLDYNTQVSNVPIPLKEDCPEAVKNYTRKVIFREGISALKLLLNEPGGIAMAVPGDLLPGIQMSAGVSMTYLMSARVEVSSTVIARILATIERKVMDILLLLDNKFGCLDELDIEPSAIAKKDFDSIIGEINVIINDNHIELGNNNTIKNSTLNG